MKEEVTGIVAGKHRTAREVHRHAMLLRQRRRRLIPPFLAIFLLLFALPYFLERNIPGGSWTSSFRPSNVTRRFAIAAGSTADTLYQRVNRGRIEQAKKMVRTIVEQSADSSAGPSSLPATPSPDVAPPVTSLGISSVRPASSSELPRRLQEDTGIFADVWRTSLTEGRGTAVEPQGTTTAPIHHRVFRLLLIGVDSRLGRSDARADAVQLFSVDLDRAAIDILAIPRGTRVSIGYENEASNILSNVRSARGRTGLLRAVSDITGCGPIAYYAEVGFSQAMGILELLGCANPEGELARLRRREGLQYGDRERSYAQARFLQKSLLNSFDLLTGVSGELLLSAGLLLVETNLTKDICQGLIYSLKEKGFPRTPADVTVRLHSPLERKVARRVEEGEDEISDGRGTEISRAEKKIRAILIRARTAMAGGRNLQIMERIVEQRGWLQIPNGETRRTLRDSLAGALIRIYSETGEGGKIRTLREKLRSEDSLFQTLRNIHASKISAIP